MSPLSEELTVGEDYIYRCATKSPLLYENMGKVSRHDVPAVQIGG